MLNITQQMSPQEILLEAHKATAIPAMIFMFISLSVIFLIIGMLLIDSKKSGYGKFLWIWFSSNVLGIIVLIALSYAPFAIQNAKNFLVNIFG